MSDKIIVKNCEDKKWNGEYFKGEVKFKDKNTISYVKGNNHHIYQYNGIWRLGINGVEVYKNLGDKIKKEIDYNDYIKRDKYVLCCPINGLNDTFNQIMKCYNYCKKTGRTLLVNTNVNHNQSMKYNFADFFDFNDADFNIICDSNIINNLLKKKKLTVINDLYNYLTDNYSMIFIGKESDGSNILCDKNTKIPLKFDFNKNYDEDILLHFQGGGGDIGYLLFNYIILNKNLKKHISNKINKLPCDYISLYIRNTDIKSDYKKLFKDNIKIIQNKNIYLATDSKISLDYFKNTNLNIFNFTTFSNENSKNLHNSNVDTNIKLYDSLTDLYLIANSNKIITNSSNGFLFLAKNLYKNKQICKNIIKPSKYFITFAGGNYFHYETSLTKSYYDAGVRLIRQAKNTRCFDKCILYTDNDLKNDLYFWNKHENFINNNKKGYGYWLWKSYIIKKTLEVLPEGSILLYCDAGCEIDSSKDKNIKEYFEIVKKDLIIGTLTYSNSESEYYGIEKRWTKKDLIKKLDMDKPEYLNSLQRQAGCVMYYVCNKTIDFVDEWYKLCCNYYLIDDTPSIEKNIIDFKEHRNDQSIFSLLTKKYGLFSNKLLSDFVFTSRNKTGKSIL